MVAIDCKLVIDDNSLYRQGDYTLLPRTSQKKSEQELEAQKYDLTYVELDPEGDIGTMAGGAGIGMATMDTIKHYGGNTTNTTTIARSLVRCISVISFAIASPAPDPLTTLPSARPPPNRSIMPHITLACA